jgi:hypothetical protein
MMLPFPTLDGYGAVSKETSQAHPIILRLEGNHILAGLRTLVTTGLDDSSTPEEAGEGSAGLPAWLSEIRGTRVSVGVDGQVLPK